MNLFEIVQRQYLRTAQYCTSMRHNNISMSNKYTLININFKVETAKHFNIVRYVDNNNKITFILFIVWILFQQALNTESFFFCVLLKSNLFLITAYLIAYQDKYISYAFF